MHATERGDSMSEIAPGWEVIARKPRGPIAHLLFLVLQVLMLSWPPVTHLSVTFTVRNRQTGETRKVTAKTEDEAALLITQGQFDRA
jgi:hypothetical protein